MYFSKPCLVLFVWCIVVLPCFPALLQTKNVNFGGGSFEKPENPTNKIRKPIVMIPGVLGSQLEAKLNKSISFSYCEKESNWFGIWLNLEELLPLAVDCWVDNMKMVYDNVTKAVKNSPGVETRVPDFGSTTAFEYLDQDKYAVSSKYFEPLVSYLVLKHGYTRDKDLHGAPFDWRLAPYQHEIFFKNLTLLVEKSYYSNNNKKVVLISHSMGSMFAYYFLQHSSQSWKDKFIDSFVSVAGPYLGSVKAVKALLSGDSEGHDWALPTLKVRTVLRSAPAFASMLPRPDLWPKNKQKIVVTLKKNYTVNDYKKLFEKIGCEWCWEHWKNNGMSLGSLSAPSVPVHCVYSSGTSTPETLVYDVFPDQSPSIVDGSGDGTVNVWSASACLQWKTQQRQPVLDVEMPGNSHVKILWNSTFHKYLNGVVLK